MLLTVIIPAYNVEKYIQTCLDSVFALPLCEDEMEVVVIDDGSTDTTPQLLAENAARHQNMRVLTQQNQGQSVARNLGIEEAQGKYIYFVDADDALTSPCPLPLLHLKAEKYDMIGLEMLIQNFDGSRKRYCHQTFPYDQEYATGREYLSHHNVLGIVYGYLFRTDFLKAHAELRFTPGIYHQDEEFVVKAFCLSGSFVYKQGYTYIYYKRKGSSIHTFTKERRERLMNDTMIVMHRLKSFAQERRFQKDIRHKMRWLTIDVIRLLIRQHHSPGFAFGIVRQLFSILHD